MEFRTSKKHKHFNVTNVEVRTDTKSKLMMIIFKNANDEVCGDIAMTETAARTLATSLLKGIHTITTPVTV
jgi:hypothetical protein